jgi:cytochrome c oxidase assembly protein subunit 11
LTGFGGTVRKAEVAPDTVLAKPISIRFDSNVRGLPWTFKAEQVSQTLNTLDPLWKLWLVVLLKKNRS